MTELNPLKTGLSTCASSWTPDNLGLSVSSPVTHWNVHVYLVVLERVTQHCQGPALVLNEDGEQAEDNVEMFSLLHVG